MTLRKPVKAKSLSWPVVMYPEGVKVGTVTSGKDRRNGKVRHVAKSETGERVGTFDSFKEAQDALIGHARMLRRKWCDSCQGSGCVKCMACETCEGDGCVRCDPPTTDAGHTLNWDEQP